MIEAVAMVDEYDVHCICELSTCTSVRTIYSNTIIAHLGGVKRPTIKIRQF